MIVSFHDQATEDLYHGNHTHRTARFPREILPASLRKLDMLHAAYRLVDLRVPPGNHLEMLHGDLQGYSSIRVNDQWRIIFRWENGNAHDVALVDYHK
jgi:toxin HigB-1